MKEQKGITLIALIITILVMLILAVVTINLTVGEGGVINKAEQAKSQMSLSQIKEKADLVNLSTRSEILAGKEMIYSHELAKRLFNEFGGRIEGNALITENDEYIISLVPKIEKDKDGKTIINNPELNISEYSVFEEVKNSIFSYFCEIVDNKLNINITRTTYSSDIQEKFKEHVDEITTLAEKEKAIAKYMELTSDGFKGVKTIDDIVVRILNSEFSPISYNTINGWLEDPEVQQYAKVELGIEELKAEHLYSFVLLDGDTTGITKEKFITDHFYNIYVYGQANLLSEIGRYVKDLEIRLYNEAGEQKGYVHTGEWGSGTRTNSIDLNDLEAGTYKLVIEKYRTAGNEKQYVFAVDTIVIK